MCGFAGFVGEVENREQVLENMIDTIIHRGPDSSGKFVDEDAALGFRRLSIMIFQKAEISHYITRTEARCLYLTVRSITIRN